MLNGGGEGGKADAAHGSSLGATSSAQNGAGGTASDGRIEEIVTGAVRLHGTLKAGEEGGNVGKVFGAPPGATAHLAEGAGHLGTEAWSRSGRGIVEQVRLGTRTGHPGEEGAQEPAKDKAHGAVRDDIKDAGGTEHVDVFWCGISDDGLVDLFNKWMWVF